jgi:hypothetical protein
MDEKRSQFDKAEADSAVSRLVDAFMTTIEVMFGKLEPVYATYVLERMLLILCHRMTKLLDDPRFAEQRGSATLKLADAMADYRDARCVDRA